MTCRLVGERIKLRADRLHETTVQRALRTAVIYRRESTMCYSGCCYHAAIMLNFIR
jgi:hypothetical protein